MPWKESSTMSMRLEFVRLASAPGANVQAICTAYKVSRKTGYKWLKRFAEEGEAGLADRSRRPHSSPSRSSDELEASVLRLHDQYDCWGSRKLQALLPQDANLPHPSTIDAILRRHGRQIHGSIKGPDAATRRFEHAEPNMLWQMDFKGHFALSDSRAGRCHPLTVLDDHSRFNLCLTACANEQTSTVKAALTTTFERYGLPDRITADNGPPWGLPRGMGISTLEAWLIRLGIRVGHSRPYHPQTQGKDERFHRTLKLEVITRRGFPTIAACQEAFDEWRATYNHLRPHPGPGHAHGPLPSQWQGVPCRAAASGIPIWRPGFESQRKRPRHAQKARMLHRRGAHRARNCAEGDRCRWRLQGLFLRRRAA
jgi:transposase InsO family protein